MIPFGTKSVTLSMLIDLLTSICRSTQVKIASTDLWPQEMFTFSEMLALVESESSFYSLVHVDRRRWRSHQLTSDLGFKRCLLFRKCLHWSSRKAVSVPTSVIGGLGATATSDLVGVCVCVCVCVIVALWVGWADVGLWVAVCFLAKIFLKRVLLTKGERENKV